MSTLPSPFRHHNIVVALSVGHCPSDACHPLHLAPDSPDLGALQAAVVVGEDPVQAPTSPFVGAVFAAGPE